MNDEEMKTRFTDTMSEITNQVRMNTESIDTSNILKLIKLILDIHEGGNRVFIYGAGRSGFVGRCFAQRLMHLGVNSCFVSDAVTHQYYESDLLIMTNQHLTSPLYTLIQSLVV